MPDDRDEIAEALEEPSEALQQAKRALHAAEKETRRALRRSDRARPMTTATAGLRASPVSRVRKPLDDALVRLERTRHRVLLAYFARALDEGMTVTELGRNYGFSRQRAAQLAKEAREL